MAVFTVNGQRVETKKNQKLLRFLRDELHLTSVKDGCSEKYYFCQIQSNTVTLQLSTYYLFLVYNSLREESGHVSRIRAILL